MRALAGRRTSLSLGRSCGTLCKSKMLKEAINIKFPQDPDPNIRNRALNYIEDIFRYLEDHQLGTIDEIDSYSNGEFIVRIKSKRKLGEIKREIIRLLNQHNLAGEGAINLIARNPR